MRKIHTFLVERKTVLFIILFSVVSGLFILLFGGGFIPIACLSLLILFSFLSYKNFLLFTIAITPMLNIGVWRIGIVDLKVSQLLWALVFAATLFNTISHPENNKGKVNLNLKIIFFILVCSSFLSVIPSDYRYISLRESVQLIYLIAIFLVVAAEINTEAMLNRAIAALLFASLVFIIFGFLKNALGYSLLPYIEIDGMRSVSFTQTLLKEQYALFGNVLFRRADAFFLGPVATAAYLISIVSLSMALLFNKVSITSPVRKVCYFSSLLGSLLILMTFSRAGIVILFLVLFVLCILERRISKHLFILVACIFLMYIVNLAHKMRLAEILLLDESSIQVHLRLWKQAIIMFFNKPILGYGAGTFYFQKYLIGVPSYLSNQTVQNLPHNMFLLIAAETGFIGITSLFLFLFVVAKKIWKSSNITNIGSLHNIVLGLFMGSVGIILMNLTMNFFKVEFFWIFLALGYAASNIAEERNLKGAR